MKGKLSKIILLGYIIINILIPISVSAESLKSGNFEKLSIDEGLSNEYVTSIFQDSKGYMWIGTIDGLNRYDGERIKVYNCLSFQDIHEYATSVQVAPVHDTLLLYCF